MELTQAKDICAPGRPDIAADVQRLFDVLRNGGIAIFRSGLGYGIGACTREALARINAAKGRGAHKRQGMVSNWTLAEELLDLDGTSREMIDCLVRDYDLPLAIVGRYRPGHPHLRGLGTDLLQLCTARGTLACGLNSGGPLHEPLAELSHAHAVPIFGSSANLTGTGQKYRIADIDPALLGIADLVLDYGLPEYHLYRAALTIIDFDTRAVVRFGACYELIGDVLERHFDWKLPADPGRAVNPSGHVDEFALATDA